MATSEESTQVEYKEEWGVQVGKEVFVLNERQIRVLKQADTSNQRGIIWFDKFAISIPHIQAIWLINRRIKNQLTAGSRAEDPEITEKERERVRKRIQEIKEKLMPRLKGTIVPHGSSR